MTLGRPVKIVVGALSLWPLLHLVLAVAFAAPRQLAIEVATVLVTFALAAFYIAFLFRTDRLDSGRKLRWAIALFACNVLAMPVFFWIHVWPDRGPAEVVTHA